MVGSRTPSGALLWSVAAARPRLGPVLDRPIGISPAAPLGPRVEPEDDSRGGTTGSVTSSWGCSRHR